MKKSNQYKYINIIKLSIIKLLLYIKHNHIIISINKYTFVPSLNLNFK